MRIKKKGRLRFFAGLLIASMLLNNIFWALGRAYAGEISEQTVYETIETEVPGETITETEDAGRIFLENESETEVLESETEDISAILEDGAREGEDKATEESADTHTDAYTDAETADGDILFAVDTAGQQRSSQTGVMDIVFYSVPSDSGLGDLLDDGKEIDHICYMALKTAAGYKTAYCVQHTAACRNDDAFYMGGSSLNDAAVREYIGRALLYGFQFSSYSRDERPSDSCLAAYTAAQITIWLILSGKYETQEADQIARAVCGASRQSADGEAYQYYLNLKEKISGHGLMPSFVSADEASAPVYTMTYNSSSGRYEIVLEDTNHVLSFCQYPETVGVDVHMAGNKLVLSSEKPLSGEVTIKITRSVEKASEAVSVWHQEDEERQEIVTFSQPGVDTVNGCFRLRTDSGYIQIQKFSADTSITDGSSCYSLEGAVYDVYGDEKCSQKIGSLITGKEGMTDRLEVPAGTCYVKESQPSEGYRLDDTIYEVSVTAEETTLLHAEEQPCTQTVIVGIIKLDAETGEQVPYASVDSFAGAQFTVRYYNGYYDKSSLPEEATRTWILETKAVDAGEDSIYTALLQKEYLVGGDELYDEVSGYINALPLGTITIEETRAPEGYIREGVYFYSAQTGEMQEGIVVMQMKGFGNARHYADNYLFLAGDYLVRGDFEFMKVDAQTQEAVADIPFKITSVTTGESHVIRTDENGFYSSASEFSLHSSQTNAGESGTGLWFGEEISVDDTRGALPYDTYIIEELRCEGNKGKMLYSGTFSITDNEQILQLGTIENENLIIETWARDTQTGTQNVAASKTVNITDLVRYQGLEPGKTYRIEGMLVNRADGKQILDCAGNPVEGSCTFIPDKPEGEAEVSFCFDGSHLAGQDLVAFEKLYDGEELLASHEDILDENQTLHMVAAEVEEKENRSFQSPAVKTGDGMSGQALITQVLMMIISGSGLILYVRKKQKGKGIQD